jgi:hypothetical protein
MGWNGIGLVGMGCDRSNGAFDCNGRSFRKAFCVVDHDFGSFVFSCFSCYIIRQS